MKKTITSLLFLTLSLMFIISCSKDENTEDNSHLSSVVLPSNANGVAKILIIPNAEVVNSPNIPDSSPAGQAPTINNIDTNISYSSGSNIIIPADVNSPSQTNIKGAYIQVKGADSFFNVIIDSNTSNGLISLPISLPSTVGTGDLILLLKFYDNNGKISSVQEIKVNISNADSCGKTKVSGGHGLTSNLFKLSDTPGKIKISYDTYTVKDKIDVFQNGLWIGGTGSYTERATLRKALKCSVATEALGYVGKKSEFLFDYNPALGKEIEVIVSGCESGGTQWQYEFSCPGNFTKSPLITTSAASLITNNSATTGAVIDLNGGSSITQRGVIWSTSTNPTTNLTTKLIQGSGSGTFSSSITNLLPNTKYYVRAFAVNADGTFYGNEISFTTTAATTFSLDGKWLSSGGLGIIISGNNGTLYSFSTNWENARSKGYVTIGSLKLKDISKVNNTKWNCKELYLTTTNSQIDGVIWSNDGSITMSADGQTITTTSTGPVSGSIGSNTYTRVN